MSNFIWMISLMVMNYTIYNAMTDICMNDLIEYNIYNIYNIIFIFYIEHVLYILCIHNIYILYNMYYIYYMTYNIIYYILYNMIYFQNFISTVLGRPNFIEIFERIKQYAISQNETKVAVSICGPAPMIATATEACRNISSSSQVQFDLQIEIFNL